MTIQTWESRYANSMQEAMQAEIDELREGYTRVNALADKWNSECDELREDNKRLAGE